MTLSVSKYLSQRDTLMNGGCGEEEGIETQAITTPHGGNGIVSVVEQPYTDNEQLLYYIGAEDVQEDPPEEEDEQPLLDCYLDLLPAYSSNSISPARSTATATRKGTKTIGITNSGSESQSPYRILALQYAKKNKHSLPPSCFLSAAQQRPC